MKKTAIITGASRGIGRETCRLFAKSGYNVIINYNSSEKEAEKLQKEIGDGSSMIFKADVSDRDAVFEMCRAAFEKFGSVDVLVNNAGIAAQKLFTDVTEEEARRMMDVNYFGAFFASQAVIPYMLKKHCGAIVNISSVWGVTGGSCEVNYSASKAALTGLTKALAKELGPSGIRVNAVAPGIIETDMMFSLSEEERAELYNETPLCRFGSAEDVAKSVLFLAEHDFITGQILGVNGGFFI